MPAIRGEPVHQLGRDGRSRKVAPAHLADRQSATGKCYPANPPDLLADPIAEKPGAVITETPSLLSKVRASAASRIFFQEALRR